MIFRDFYFHFREMAGDFLSQHGNHGILCVEMTGIDEIQSQILCVPKLVVFYIGCDKSVTARVQRIQHTVGAAAAADGNLADGLAAIYVAQTIAMEFLLYGCKKIAQRLFCGFTHTQKIVDIAGKGGYIFQT